MADAFAGQPNVIGQTLRIGGDANTVIGVLPPEVRFPRIALASTIPSPQGLGNIFLYQPYVPAENDLKTDLGNFNFRVIARLKPGATIAQANAELDALQKAYTIAAHLPVHLGIALSPLSKDAASGVSGALWLLLAAVGAVLLIGCVNLANLQLARAINAERETAVRAALGASRMQLFRGRLTECLVLAMAGGIAGCAFAFAGVRALVFCPGEHTAPRPGASQLAGAAVCRCDLGCRGACFWNRAGASLAARASTDGITGECIALRQHADRLACA